MNNTNNFYDMIEDQASLQRSKIQSRLNAMNIEEIPLPPRLERSEVFRGSKPKKSFGDEEELIGERVLCSWVNPEEKSVINLQSGILKNIDFVNGKKYYYVAIDRKDYAGKIVKDEFIMDFPAEHVRIEATEDIVYPSTRDSNGHITENESGLEQEKRLLEEQKEKEQRKGGKKRKTYKKSKRATRTRLTRCKKITRRKRY